MVWIVVWERTQVLFTYMEGVSTPSPLHEVSVTCEEVE
jgi:hypothetical protein